MEIPYAILRFYALFRRVCTWGTKLFLENKNHATRGVHYLLELRLGGFRARVACRVYHNHRWGVPRSFFGVGDYQCKRWSIKGAVEIGGVD